MRVGRLFGAFTISFAHLGSGTALAATAWGVQTAQARLKKADRELASRAASAKGDRP